MRRRRLVLGLAGAASTPLCAAPTWPARSIRMLVPFPGGSSPDLVARAIAEPLGKVLGQVIVVDNRPGAGGNIGTGLAARAAADGYTLLFTIQGPLVTAPLLSKRLGYDPQKDLQPIGLVATSPNVLVVDAALGAHTVAEFVSAARSRPGALNYGSIGNGSAAHLAMESFMARAGIALTHVPYAGFAQVLNAMLAGQIQAGFMVPGLAMAQVRAGRLRALAVSSLGRVAALPELPTLAELGFAGFEAVSWQALLAPAGTPSAIVARLSEELQRIVKSEALRAKLMTQYFSAAPSSPDGLAALMKTERERWAKVIRAAGVQPE